MEDLVQQFSNVGLTILCIAVACLFVNWLDRNVFNKHRSNDND